MFPEPAVIVIVLLAALLFWIVTTAKRLAREAGQTGRRRPRVRLVPLKRRRDRPQSTAASQAKTEPVAEHMPYRFARFAVERDGYLDLSTDGDLSRLARYSLPPLRTPEDIADWVGMSVGKLAWLTHHCRSHQALENVERSHYHYHWMRKRSGGWRLIEAPKTTLKSIQHRILAEILQNVPPHASSHGFVSGRSIVSNAKPHAGHRVLVKLDLDNFYANVRFARVVAIYRSLGYSREAAIWLARLTTSALPLSMPFPEGDASALRPFFGRHLPQGAPTSPALANLSAFGLDVRLTGLARAFEARYTRYADDLTFSGPQRFLRSLRVFLPLATQVVRSERFRVNVRKRRVIRDNQRQTVTGVVVNEHPNVSRRDFDRLKAILTNCVRHGPSTQNRDGRPDFAAWLAGRIGHVRQLNPHRGEKLLSLFSQVDWSR